jgi:hypothetical protein
MDQWDMDYIDMLSPGQITFKKDGTGQLHFGCVDVGMDWSFVSQKGQAEFTFSGFDEGDEVNGHGWAKLNGSHMHGEVAFHLGDKSSFAAVKSVK